MGERDERTTAQKALDNRVKIRQTSSGAGNPMTSGAYDPTRVRVTEQPQKRRRLWYLSRWFITLVCVLAILVLVFVGANALLDYLTNSGHRSPGITATQQGVSASATSVNSVADPNGILSTKKGSLSTDGTELDMVQFRLKPNQWIVVYVSGGEQVCHFYKDKSLFDTAVQANMSSIWNIDPKHYPLPDNNGVLEELLKARPMAHKSDVYGFCLINQWIYQELRYQVDVVSNSDISAEQQIIQTKFGTKEVYYTASKTDQLPYRDDDPNA